MGLSQTKWADPTMWAKRAQLCWTWAGPRAAQPNNSNNSENVKTVHCTRRSLLNLFCHVTFHVNSNMPTVTRG